MGAESKISPTGYFSTAFSVQVAELWHDDLPFAGIELKLRESVNAELARLLLLNDTGDDCSGHGYVKQ